MLRLLKHFIYLNFICFSFYSCNQPQNKPNEETESGSDFLKNNPGYDKNAIDPKASLIVINLSSSGNTMSEMRFNMDTIFVKAGCTVSLNFKNNSTDMAMQHNFVLVDPEAVQNVADMGLKAGKENDFVPNLPTVYVHTKMTLPGESDTIRFPAPPTGYYKFICTYPGHYSMMQGVFIVE